MIQRVETILGQSSLSVRTGLFIKHAGLGHRKNSRLDRRVVTVRLINVMQRIPAHVSCSNDERRHSARWSTNKVIRWRMNRGQMTRTGLLKERSLNGLMILVENGRKPKLDSRIRISPELAERLGCKTAIVRRFVDATAPAFKFVAEIES